MARVLLADDDATARELVQRALLGDGHHVVVAQDGSEALSTLATGEPIDVLVSDVQMPGIDGIELASRLLQTRPGVRILLMSGYPEQLARSQSLKGGVVATLVKPCSLQDIREALKALLG